MAYLSPLSSNGAGPPLCTCGRTFDPAYPSLDQHQPSYLATQRIDWWNHPLFVDSNIPIGHIGGIGVFPREMTPIGEDGNPRLPAFAKVAEMTGRRRAGAEQGEEPKPEDATNHEEAAK